MPCRARLQKTAAVRKGGAHHYPDPKSRKPQGRIKENKSEYDPEVIKQRRESIEHEAVSKLCQRRDNVGCAEQYRLEQ